MIRLEDVRFAYADGGAALACPRLEIGPGLTLLVGPNGAGKSTLLRLLAGIEEPDAGRIRYGGHDLWRDEVAARARLAYVPEQPDLTPYATVGEVVRLVCRLRGRPAEEGAAVLRDVGLGGLERRSIREMSMGQRRRVMLATALVGTPEVVILDEPLEAMDRAMQQGIVRWVGDLRAQGRSVLLATHDLEPFLPLAERALAVRGGTVRLLDPLPADPAERAALLAGAAGGD